MYNANNYGYNPFNRYIPQQPLEQPQMASQNVIQNNFQPRPYLNGKQVESIDVVKAMDIPMDGSISYFPIADGSAIVTKQLCIDGTSKTTIYKQVQNNTENDIKYATSNDIDYLKNKINKLQDQIKSLKNTNKKGDKNE